MLVGALMGSTEGGLGGGGDEISASSLSPRSSVKWESYEKLGLDVMLSFEFVWVDGAAVTAALLANAPAASNKTTTKRR